MTNKVHELGAHERMSVEEALAKALREAPEFSDVLILAIRASTNSLVVCSSAMSNANAAWLCDKGKMNAHGLLEGD